jgi:hypothetical protein
MKIVKNFKNILIFLLITATLSWASAVCYAQRVGNAPEPRKFDEYRYEHSTEEKRLARFAQQLKREPLARAYVIAYSARSRRFNDYEAETLLHWARAELESGGIRPERIVTIDGGIREEPAVELWVVPRDAAAPRPRPTARPGDVVYCPHISIWGDQYVLKPDKPLEFTAQLANGDPKLKPAFKWEVSGGRIIRGQGSNTIAVEAEGAASGKVTVTVEVVGLSPDCSKEASHATVVGVTPYEFDEYGDIRIGDEKARLDHLAIHLEKEPRLQAYLISYGGRQGRRNEGPLRAARAKNYLVNTRGIEGGRIVTIDGGYREGLTLELWLSPRSGEVPVPTPTVDERYVRFNGRRR